MPRLPLNIHIPEMDVFLQQCTQRHLPAHQTVLKAGELSETLFFIITGSVSVVIEDEQGHDLILAYLNPGDFFGEMGLFETKPIRSAWIRTKTRCDIAEISYTRFRELARQNAGLVFALSAQMAGRLRATSRKVGDLAFLDVTGRIAHAVLDLCKQPDAMTHPDGMQIKVTRQDLGRMVGCSREMAGRVLKSLEDQGLIKARGKTMVVYGTR